MKVSAKDVEAMFAAEFGIASDARTAFRRRIDHLRSHGCPSNLATGRGRPAIYGWQQLVEQALAFELLNLGLSPERAAIAVLDPKNDAQSLCYQLVFTTGWSKFASSAGAFQSDTWPIEATMLLRYQPFELFSLAEKRSQPDHTLLPVDGLSISTLAQHRSAQAASGILIDLGLLFLSLFRAISTCVGATEREVVTDFLEWAEAYDIDT